MGNLVNWPPTWATLLLLPALFVGFTVHELAHALVAFLLGDTTQVERKRLSFNPIRHVSWLGMIAFLLIGVGWAKPVWVDESRFRVKNRAFGMFLVSVSGSTANLLTAIGALFGMTAMVMIVWVLNGTPPADVLGFLIVADPAPDAQGVAVAFTYYMIMVNLLLAFFNLLPLPPLDGFRALLSLYELIRGALAREPEEGLLPQPEAATAEGEASVQSPAQIHFGIGLTYHQAGQWDEAIARYRQAIAQDGEFALAYYNLGLAYWAKGRLPLASSAFRAAMQATGDPGLQVQAGMRLRELSQAEADPDAELGLFPPPLEPGHRAEAPASTAPPLDPALARRVWLRLGIGGALTLILAAAIWLYVTAVILASVG
jgi:Zn-dependent protease